MKKDKYTYNLMKYYDDYKKTFGFLDERTYYVLRYKGKIGALLKGEEISLKDDGIFIEENWYRYHYYLTNKIPIYL